MQKNSNSLTPLGSAIIQRNIQITQYLITKQNCDPVLNCWFENNALQLSLIHHKKSFSLIKYLLTFLPQCDVNRKDCEGVTLLERISFLPLEFFSGKKKLKNKKYSRA